MLFSPNACQFESAAVPMQLLPHPPPFSNASNHCWKDSQETACPPFIASHTRKTRIVTSEAIEIDNSSQGSKERIQNTTAMPLDNHHNEEISRNASTRENLWLTQKPEVTY
jgi:hypothetical protein